MGPTSTETETASAASRRVFAALLLIAACSSQASESSTTRVGFDPVTTVGTFDPITTIPTTTGTASSVTSTTVSSAAGGATPSPADQLVVAPEHLEGYDRGLFEHWTDADRDGCSTRCEVLEAERRPDVGWVSIYDGFVTTDPAQLQIDHLVALAEAWRSGAWAWDNARREAFANDLEEPDALVAVSGASNQSKADKDPAEWRPPLRSAWCQWATAWIRVKVKWQLTADPAERSALRLLTADC